MVTALGCQRMSFPEHNRFELLFRCDTSDSYGNHPLRIATVLFWCLQGTTVRHDGVILMTPSVCFSQSQSPCFSVGWCNSSGKGDVHSGVTAVKLVISGRNMGQGLSCRFHLCGTLCGREYCPFGPSLSSFETFRTGWRYEIVGAQSL